MEPPYPLIYLHGLLSDSQGVKAGLLRQRFPEIVIPDFEGSLEERMERLYSILGDTSDWTIVGSSFGGLMGAMFTRQRPEQVRKLVLFSPALIWPDFARDIFDRGDEVHRGDAPVSVPTVIYHGLRDDLVPIETVRTLAGQVFQNLAFHAVDDDHGMYKTVHEIDWEKLLKDKT
jgi:pimeloyl-ACP methyl ester carboxylesterase